MQAMLKAVVAKACVVSAGLALAVGCGASPTGTVAPSAKELPPIPPSPSTSVAILVDARATLKLSADQTGRLTLIKTELTAVNRPIEQRVAKAEAARSARAQQANANRGGGMRRGRGMRGRGMRRGGSRGRPPPGNANKNKKNKKNQGKRHYTSAHIALMRAHMMRNNKIALARAWTLLDASQRARAKQLLDLHGHDGPDPRLVTAPYAQLRASGDRAGATAGGRQPTANKQPTTNTRPTPKRPSRATFVSCVSERLGLSKYQALRFEELISGSLTPRERDEKLAAILSDAQRPKLAAVARACKAAATNT